MTGRFGRRMVSRVFSLVPVSVLGAMTRTRLLIGYYHMVSDEDVAHVRHLYGYKTIRQFTDDLDFIASSYWPIDLRELLTHVRNGRALPGRAFLLTFDDGFGEMHDVVAPILARKGMSATFFVNSAFVDNRELCYLNKASLLVEVFRRNRSAAVKARTAEVLRSAGHGGDVKPAILSIKYRERALLDQIAETIGVDFGEYLRVRKPYLTSDHIRALVNDGFSIGGHSIDHPLYASIGLEEQVRQTVQSVTFVKDRFDLGYGAFAFPHTDSHVSQEFFRRIAESQVVDVSFGTRGLLDERIQSHWQRVSLEKPIEAAHPIVAFEYARRLRKLMTGSALVARS